MTTPRVDRIIRWVSLLYIIHQSYQYIFLLWEKYKYSLDEHPKAHPGSIDIAINAIDLIPYGISTSVPTDIYISTNDYSVDYLDPVN